MQLDRGLRGRVAVVQCSRTRVDSAARAKGRSGDHEVRSAGALHDSWVWAFGQQPRAAATFTVPLEPDASVRAVVNGAKAPAGRGADDGRPMTVGELLGENPITRASRLRDRAGLLSGPHRVIGLA